MLFTFLLIIQTIIAAALVTVILMQRSEGGGLGVGGNSSGLMSARGAADFLTRATAVLATLFVVLSIALAGIAASQRAPGGIDASLARQPGQGAPLAPGAAPLAPGAVPLADDPLAGAAQAVGETPAPTPPGNRLPTPEINRPTTPVPGATRANPARAPAGDAREVRPPIVDPAVNTGGDTTVPPAAPKQ